MPYSEKEYAVAVVGALQLTGKKAEKYIKDQFNLKVPVSSIWRIDKKLDKEMPEHLKLESEGKIKKHIQRLELFRKWRVILNTDIDKEDNREKRSRMILRAAELEKYIAQLESMSRDYYEKSTRQILVKND